VGEAHRWYGNFAFVRMWQGKSVLLCIFLPLVQAYALELALRPSAGAWLRLAAAQIAALGCSSSAVWAAPAAALAAGACALPPSRRGLMRLSLVGLAGLYVIGVGVGLKQAVALDEQAYARTAEEVTPAEQAELEARRQRQHAPGAQLREALDLVVGSSWLRSASLAALVAAWAFCPAGLARRFAVVVPLAVLLVLLDPYLSRWISRNVTGPSIWRALWVLPVPLLMALVLTSPLRLPQISRWSARAATLSVCAVFAFSVPSFAGLSSRNDVELAWPRLKVVPETYRWASLLTERAGPGAVVVAPGPVSLWLPTFHHRVSPLVVRPMYIWRYHNQLGDENARHRVLMANYAAGEAEHPDAPELFALGLERFEVDAVCLRSSIEARRARGILRRAGFRLDLKTLEYEIWLRS
jgi:hypothetical protein